MAPLSTFRVVRICFSPFSELPSNVTKPVDYAARGGAVDAMNDAERWEIIRELGGGGQSRVSLVRSPARVGERLACLEKIRKALDGDKRAELANAIVAYGRPETLSELGALKKFIIRPGSDEQQATGRLKQEIEVLKQERSGLPKLLDSNEAERWIVTEFFPRGTLEDNISTYQGKPGLALRAFGIARRYRYTASRRRDGSSRHQTCEYFRNAG